MEIHIEKDVRERCVVLVACEEGNESLQLKLLLLANMHCYL